MGGISTYCSPQDQEDFMPLVRQLSENNHGLPIRSSYDANFESSPTRREILKEIVQTEVTYVRGLRDIKGRFLNPMQETGLLPKDLPSLLASVDIIVDFHENKLLPQLKSERNISKVFIKEGNFFKMYKVFINRIPRIQKIVQSERQRSARFSKLMETSDKLGSPLDSLLILPVQRLPRYQLLLEDLMSHTMQNHEEFSDIKVALDKVTEVLNFLNEDRRKREQQIQFIQTYKKIKGFDEPLYNPTRRFYMEQKCYSRINETTFTCFFFLFTDIVILCDKSYEFIDKVDLLEIGDCHPFPKSSKKGFSLGHLKLIVDTEIEQKECMAAINKQIEIIRQSPELYARLSSSPRK